MYRAIGARLRAVRRPGTPGALVPGIALCTTVTAFAHAIAAAERLVFGKAWIEALVLAILLGAALRTVRAPGPAMEAGIRFCARHLLEFAVMLLGLSISTQVLAAAGAPLLAGIAAVVVLAILASLAVALLLRLPVRMALLIACGNAICGNSAIAAVAPVIGADSDDVAASIAFTAVLGVIVVLVLPVLGIAAGLAGVSYGAFAGLTVYAVPQVIAATAPAGAAAVQMGTLVKLVRVLMLGPVCLVLSLVAGGLPRAGMPPGDVVAGGSPRRARLSKAQLVPWFIAGFMVMAAVRSFGLVPAVVLDPAGRVATWLTVLSMAALGLGVDVHAVAQAGMRVTLAVVASLLALGGISLMLLHILGIAP